MYYKHNKTLVSGSWGPAGDPCNSEDTTRWGLNHFIFIKQNCMHSMKRDKVVYELMFRFHSDVKVAYANEKYIVVLW